jgi:hypothetical protein
MRRVNLLGNAGSEIHQNIGSKSTYTIVADRTILGHSDGRGDTKLLWKMGRREGGREGGTDGRRDGRRDGGTEGGTEGG